MFVELAKAASQACLGWHSHRGMILSIMLVSAVQHSDSVIRVCVYIYTHSSSGEHT